MADSDQATEPVQCAAGCGFFGNPANDNLCSKCAREIASEKGTVQAPVSSAPSLSTPVSPATPKPVVPTAPSEPAAPIAIPSLIPTVATPQAVASADPPDQNPSEEGQPKKKKARCFECKKKTGMLGFTCRCGKLFCSTHRHSDMHSCAFDYETHGKAIIAKNNEAVIADKLERL